MNIDKSKPVLVTGATGYVAGWLVEKLLQEGLTVHAAVRDPENKEKIQPLQDLGDLFPGSIRFFASDLLKQGSYKEAMEGCELVYHTASPFIVSVDDPQKELIDPALLGTRNILEEANRTDSVKRVVLTSSCAAIYGDNIDVLKAPGEILTEEIWNETSSLTHQAYAYSKTLAEKEAWKINKAQSRWDLVVVNPSMVIGPALNPRAITSESFRILKQLGDGSVKSGVPKMGFGVVDVRDLAVAHFQAGFLSQAKGRHILSGYNTTLLGLAETLLPDYGERYPIPRKIMPKFLVWLFGPMINKALTRTYVAKNAGYLFAADNSKSIKALGVKYRPLEDSMKDTFRQMIEQNYFATT